MPVKDSNFQKSLNNHLIRYISKVFVSVVKQSCYVTAFLWNCSQRLLATLALIVARVLQGYACLPEQDTGYQKSAVKTLLNSFFTVKGNGQTR